MDIVLNEVLYDPAGADGGYEYVELAAVAGADDRASLAGWVIETANGADGVWRVAWTGTSADSLQDGRFVVGESGVEPSPDAIEDLDLQNGPDACRLRSPEGDTDTLGWGEGLPPGLYEAEAAEDVGSGLALARLPDGFDTDRNVDDFAAVAPSPGAFNAPAEAIAVDRFEGPERGLPPGTAWDFRLTARNAGRETWTRPIGISCDLHPGELLATFDVVAAWRPGERREFLARAVPPAGAHLPRPSPGGDGVAPEPWLGVGEDFWISEVHSRPRLDEVEWIELEIGDASLELGALRVEDAAGTAAAATGVVPARTFVVITPDTSAVRARWNPPGSLLQASSWPSLNHTGSGVAERILVHLGDVELASASLPGGGEEGVSWERVSRFVSADDLSAWGPSLAAAGATPGRANSRRGDRASPPGGAELALTPSRFSPTRDGTLLVVVRGVAPSTSCEVDVYDSAGRAVTKLGTWTHVGEERRAVWDGRDANGAPLPFGIYLASARTGNRRSRPAPVVLLR
ncbi:MAG: hypothetical protein KC591_08950 [Gemmatimonadetes bacterium]|nr:hypothetical protein [Gemmatimonadota bacterium]